MKYPKVSIIVPNWNGGEKIIRCLDSVKKLDYPSFEVFIIDNGSTDGTKEKIKKDFVSKKNKKKKFNLIENDENLGCVKAINQGFEASRGEHILRLDDDIVLRKDLLKELVKFLQNHKRVGIVIPKVYYYKKPKVICNLGFSINPLTGKTYAFGENEIDKGQFNKSFEVDYVPGAVLLVKKEAVQKAGKLSEDFFVYYEDAEWCSRIRKKGYKIIYNPKTVAWHDCKTANELSPFRIYHYIRSKILFMRKTNTTLENLFFIPFVLFVYSPFKILSFLKALKFSFVSSYLKGLKSGLFS